MPRALLYLLYVPTSPMRAKTAQASLVERGNNCNVVLWLSPTYVLCPLGTKVRCFARRAHHPAERFSQMESVTLLTLRD